MVSISMWRPWRPALRYQINSQSGDIQITDAYSTDAELARYDLQVLEDDKQLFHLIRGSTNEKKLFSRNIWIGDGSQ